MRLRVYTLPQCPWCSRLKDFLKQHGISFEEVDVSDRKAAEEMIRKSGQTGVPVTEVNDEIIVGFDEERLRKVLNL